MEAFVHAVSSLLEQSSCHEDMQRRIGPQENPPTPGPSSTSLVISAPSHSNAPLPDPSFPAQAPLQDGVVGIAAALSQMLTMNHAANEQVEAPPYTAPVAQTATPSAQKISHIPASDAFTPVTKAFNEFIDQSQFHQGNSPTKPSDDAIPFTLTRPITEEELQHIVDQSQVPQENSLTMSSDDANPFIIAPPITAEELERITVPHQPPRWQTPPPTNNSPTRSAVERDM